MYLISSQLMIDKTSDAVFVFIISFGNLTNYVEDESNIIITIFDQINIIILELLLEITKYFNINIDQIQGISFEKRSTQF